MFGKRSKSSAVAFVDYEHWFYGYSNSFQMKPNVSEWLQELKRDFKIKSLYVFGDFVNACGSAFPTSSAAQIIIRLAIKVTLSPAYSIFAR